MSIHFPRRRAALAGSCLAVALLAACASGPDVPKPVAPVAPVAKADAKVLHISEANAGADVTLEAGQSLIVSLGGEVSSPYDWTLVDMKPGVLAVESSRFERTPRDAYLADLGVLTIWTLKSIAPGAITLSFDLRRPHSLLPAIRTVTYQVVVK